MKTAIVSVKIAIMLAKKVKIAIVSVKIAIMLAKKVKIVIVSAKMRKNNKYIFTLYHKKEEISFSNSVTIHQVTTREITTTTGLFAY